MAKERTKEPGEAFASQASTFKPMPRKRRVWREDSDSSETRNDAPVVEEAKTQKSESGTEPEAKVLEVSVSEQPSPDQTFIQATNEERNEPIIEKRSIVEEKKLNTNENLFERKLDGLKQYEARFSYHSKFEGLFKGYTRLPNKVLMEMIGGNLTAFDMKVYLAILRLTVGFQKKAEAISYSVLADMIKSGNSTRVSKSLKTLESVNLISRKSGNMNSPNILGIIDVEQLENSKTLSSYVDKKSKNTDSKHVEIGSSLSAQIEGISPKSKRDEARVIIKELLPDYTENEILEAYSYVKRKGTLKGETAHSPFRYIRTAIGEVLVRVSEEKQKQERAEQNNGLSQFDMQEIKKKELQTSIIDKLEMEFDKSVDIENQKTLIKQAREKCIKSSHYYKAMDENNSFFRTQAQKQWALETNLFSEKELSFLP